MAEGVGFEPTEVLPSTVFKTAAFDHSAIPPFSYEPTYLPFHSEMVNIFVLSQKWLKQKRIQVLINHMIIISVDYGSPFAEQGIILEAINVIRNPGSGDLCRWLCWLFLCVDRVDFLWFRKR